MVVLFVVDRLPESRALLLCTLYPAPKAAYRGKGHLRNLDELGEHVRPPESSQKSGGPNMDPNW